MDTWHDLADVKAKWKPTTKPKTSLASNQINRPDLWSVEGLARGMRCYLKLESGPRNYVVGEQALDVTVDSRLRQIRHFIAC
jgi:hypothetical protein